MINDGELNDTLYIKRKWNVTRKFGFPKIPNNPGDCGIFQNKIFRVQKEISNPSFSEIDSLVTA